MYLVAVFLPLAGSLVAGILAFSARSVVQTDDKKSKKHLDLISQLVTCGAMLLASLAAILVFISVIFNGEEVSVKLFTWVNIGSLDFSWELRVRSGKLTVTGYIIFCV